MKSIFACAKMMLRQFPRESWGLVASELLLALILPFNLSYLAQMIDGIGQESSLLPSLLIFCFLNLMTILLSYLQKKSSLHLSLAVKRELNLNLLRCCRDLSYRHFAERESLNLLSLADEAADGRLAQLFLHLIALISGILRLLGLIVIFARTGALLPLFYLIVLAGIVFLDFKAISMMNKMFEGQSERERRFSYYEGELGDRHTVFFLQAIGGLHLFQKRLRALARDLYKERFQTTLRAQRYAILSRLLILSWFLFSIYTLSNSVFRGGIELGLFVVAISALSLALDISEEISVNLSSLGEDSFYYKKYLDYQNLLETDAKEQRAMAEQRLLSSEKSSRAPRDELSSEAPLLSTARAELSARQPAAPFIEIRDLSFRYPGTEKWVLQKLHLEIFQDEKVALVGLNGCGKSTLIKLLLGLYRAEQGEILIQGRAIESYSRAELAGLFSTVFQDYARFDLTLADNIDLARDNGENTDVEALLVQLGLPQLRGELKRPLGRLDADALDLSGGEWQKVAIARALKKRGKFLLFDEPLSAVDPVAEAELYADLVQLLEDRGALLISHRLGSARKAERILVMREGEIVEMGTHAELMAQGALYAQMFREQSKWYQ